MRRVSDLEAEQKTASETNEAVRKVLNEFIAPAILQFIEVSGDEEWRERLHGAKAMGNPYVLAIAGDELRDNENPMSFCLLDAPGAPPLAAKQVREHLRILFREVLEAAVSAFARRGPAPSA